MRPLLKNENCNQSKDRSPDLKDIKQGLTKQMFFQQKLMF